MSATEQDIANDVRSIRRNVIAVRETVEDLKALAGDGPGTHRLAPGWTSSIIVPVLMVPWARVEVEASTTDAGALRLRVLMDSGWQVHSMTLPVENWNEDGSWPRRR